MIHDAKRPRAQGTRKRGPRASARSEARNVLEFRLMRMHFACLSVRARARKVRASADQGPKLGQRNIGQRPYACRPAHCHCYFLHSRGGPLQGAVPRWLDRSMTLLLSRHHCQHVEDAPGSDRYIWAHCSTKVFLVPKIAGRYLVVGRLSWADGKNEFA